MESTAVAQATTDELEQMLTRIESLIARGRAMQMEAIRELDRRQVPTWDGCRTLAEWVAGRMDVTPETAVVLARTARATAELARLPAELEAGRITFDRAAELATGATADSEAHLMEATAGLDLASVRKRVAARRRLNRSQEHTAFRNRYLAIQPSLDESTWRLHGRLPGFAGRVVEKALTERADEFPAPPPGLRTSRTQRNADALVAIAQDSLDGDGTGDATAGGPLVTVFVDATDAAASHAETGVRIEAGPRVGPETIEAILCEGTVEVAATTADGAPLSVGRSTRVVSPRLRRFVLHRDGGCVADGCTSRYRLQPHHVIPYSQGGRTDADNLTSLCWYHHHVVIHGHGYRIDPASPAARVRFLRPRAHDPP